MTGPQTPIESLGTSRRAVVRFGIAAVVLLHATFVQVAISEAAEQPNIVWIMADDLGYGDLGCYGQKQVRTPHLDRMARQGTRFTDFYAGSTVCAPSRCVLMTGMHTGHCYIRGNGKTNLEPEHVTVAEVLKGAGYATGQFGKWGLGHEGSTGLPTRQGFDRFFGYLDQHHAHNYYPTFLISDGERYPLKNVVPKEGQYGQGVATEKNEYAGHLITEKCLEWVDEVADAKETPFFLYWSMTPPHANNEAGRKGMEIPDYGEYADEDWPEQQKGTAAMISLVDSDVGKLLAMLKEHGQDENTVVFFTSDNGPHAEGGNDPDFFNSNGPLRGIKRALYEGGIRVPMIVRWPGHVPDERISDHVGYSGDFLATACELAGVKGVPETDGISFVAACLGDREQREHEFLFWEFYEQGGRKAVRAGNWKAVLQGWDTTGHIELYNLASDLGEATDVSEKHPEIVETMRKRMIASHTPTDLWKVRGRPAKPAPKKSVSARLEKKIDAVHEGTPLYAVIESIAKQTGVRLEIDGDALKNKGYTRSMRQKLDLEGVAAEEVLVTIAEKYDGMKLEIDEENDRAVITAE